MNPINNYEVDSGINRALRYTDSEKAQRWAKTVWRKWLLRQSEFSVQIPTTLGPAARITRHLQRALGGLTTHKNIDVDQVLEHAKTHKLGYIYELEISGNWCMLYAPWQWRLLLEPCVDWWRVDSREGLRNILDWMCASPRDLPADISRLSADQAQEASYDWHERIANKHKATFYDLGMREQIAPGIWCLRDEQSLWYEGQNMHHCVGSYWSQVRDRIAIIYHVEEPRCTVEAVSGRIVQYRGVCNAGVTLPQHVFDTITKHSILEYEKTRVQNTLPPLQQVAHADNFG